MLLQATPNAIAANRVALLIGNSNYQHETNLANPVNDAQLLANTFRYLSFDQVIVVTNANRIQLNTALVQFKRLSVGAEVAVIYYSGHGMMSSSRHNYVLPTDIPKIANNANLDLDLELENNAILADKMVEVLTGSKIKILILDACRDGPVAKLKSANKGLARMSQAETKGMLIAYATEEGKVAEDGAGKNSTYASSLAKYFAQKDLSILAALDNVAKDVEIATKMKQSPTRYGNLRVDAYLNFQKKVLVSTSSSVSNVINDQPETTILITNENLNEETDFWNSIKTSQNKSDYESYLNKYPFGSFVKLAESKLVALFSFESTSLMQTDLIWRNEANTLTKFDLTELEKKSENCEVKPTFLLVENSKLILNKNSNIKNYFKNLKCAVDNTQNPLLIHSLATFYLKGLGTEKNTKLAFELYTKASLLGNLNSINSLGDLYFSGTEAELNLGVAFNFYKYASDLGNPAGMNSLGNMYRDAINVNQNLNKSFELYRAAALLNYGPAMNNLGNYFRKGIVVDKNPTIAFYWINKAVQLEVPEAYVQLIDMYNER